MAGLPSQEHLNGPCLRDAVQKEVSRLSTIYENILDKNGAELFHERAQLTGPHTIELLGSGRELSAAHILIAVGGTPFIPDMPGKEHALTSNEVFLMDTLPERAVVIGGGYIACEFASIFAGLGASTTQVYRGDVILRGFDTEVRKAVDGGQRRNGIQMKYGLSPVAIKKLATGYKISFDDGSQIGTDLVMMATGRVPATPGSGA